MMADLGGPLPREGLEEKLEERDFKFRDRVLRCNHWRLDLRSLPR